MASYDATFTNRRTGVSSSKRVYSRSVAGAVRAARRRGDTIVREYRGGRSIMTITSADLRWEERYEEVARGSAPGRPSSDRRD